MVGWLFWRFTGTYEIHVPYLTFHFTAFKLIQSSHQRLDRATSPLLTMAFGIAEPPHGYVNGFSHTLFKDTTSDLSGNVDVSVKPVPSTSPKSSGLNGHLNEFAQSERLIEHSNETVQSNGACNGVSHPEVESIAIIDMGMRLSGGVHDAESF